MEEYNYNYQGTYHARRVAASTFRYIHVLVVSGSSTPEDVMHDLRSRIEPFKVPRECLVVDDIPLSHNGKVDRRAVAELLGEPHESITETR